MNKKISEETRRKLSEKRKGKYHTKETKKKISSKKVGDKNPMYGKKPWHHGKHCSDSLANDKDWLYQKYVIEEMSWKDFYEKYQISYTQLSYRLKEFNIRREKKKEPWNKDMPKEELIKHYKNGLNGGFEKGHSLGVRFGRDVNTSGSNHYNWKGGITSENIKIRNSIKTKEWRNKIFERDEYTCKECGKKGLYLEAHHIKSFSEHPELRFETSNGIALCKQCHNKTKKNEKAYEHKYNTINKHGTSYYYQLVKGWA